MAGVKKPRPGSNLNVRIAHPGLRELVVTYILLARGPNKNAPVLSYWGVIPGTEPGEREAGFPT